MTLAADATLIKVGASIKSFRVVNGDIIYASALVGLALPGHGSEGFILPYAPAAFLCPIGFAMDAAITGDSSGTPVPRQSVDIGGGIIRLTVTGIANTVADVGKKVFPLTDNTFNLVEILNQIRIGNIVDSVSSTQVDVLVPPMFKLLNDWYENEQPTPTPTATPSPTPTPT